MQVYSENHMYCSTRSNPKYTRVKKSSPGSPGSLDSLVLHAINTTLGSKYPKKGDFSQCFYFKRSPYSGRCIYKKMLFFTQNKRIMDLDQYLEKMITNTIVI